MAMKNTVAWSTDLLDAQRSILSLSKCLDAKLLKYIRVRCITTVTYEFCVPPLFRLTNWIHRHIYLHLPPKSEFVSAICQPTQNIL